MDINHYLKTFERKKGAIAQSECLRQAPTKIKNIYKEHYKDTRDRLPSKLMLSV